MCISNNENEFLIAGQFIKSGSKKDQVIRLAIDTGVEDVAYEMSSGDSDQQINSLLCEGNHKFYATLQSSTKLGFLYGDSKHANINVNKKYSYFPTT